MANWFLLVESNCADPGREAQFNEWYDKTHLPDILETPGFVRATGRFVAADEAIDGLVSRLFRFDVLDQPHTSACNTAVLCQ